MEKLFYTDTHLLDFTTQIIDCFPDEKERGVWITLQETAFFPEEGGQAADQGTINDLEVLDVQIKNDIIYHLIKTTDNTCTVQLTPGQTITGHVDWVRRFDFMQQHSGEHIISGLLHHHYGFHNVGFHLGTSEVTLDFDQTISLDMLREIEKEANEIIWKNLPVLVSFPSKDELAKLEYRSKIEIEGAVRIVEIPGVDVCACCAPHVERTGEIGMIKITGLQNHRGGVRINILCGSRALSDYTIKQDITASLSALLSSKQDKLTDHVKRVMDETLYWKNKSNQLAEQLLEMQLAALLPAETDPNPTLFIELDNTVAIRNAVNNLCQNYPGYCSVFSGNDAVGYRFIIGSSSKDCRELAALLKTSLGAKGGGSSLMIQGNISASAKEILSVIHTL